ncbi:hypothetical protein S83_063308 [Arachis hypogaea]
MKSFMTYESNVLFALRFMIDCNIAGGNWIEIPAGKYKKTARSLSNCQLEFDCFDISSLEIAEFPILGRIRNSRVRVKDTTFSSRQYGTRESKEVAVEGRVQFDLLQLQSEDENDAEPKTKVRLIVPNGSCGGIIGKGGATIRSFIEESQAGIKISPQDNNYYGLNDRLVTLTGTLDDNKCFNTDAQTLLEKEEENTNSNILPTSVDRTEVSPSQGEYEDLERVLSRDLSGLDLSDQNNEGSIGILIQWLHNLQSEIGILADGTLALRQVLIQGVDMFGKRIGCETYAVLTEQVRVPTGRIILELPAGMLDDDKGDFVGTAVEEETGIKFKLEDMVDLTAFLDSST